MRAMLQILSHRCTILNHTERTGRCLLFEVPLVFLGLLDSDQLY
jgi:hypothetical protein